MTSMNFHSIASRAIYTCVLTSVWAVPATSQERPKDQPEKTKSLERAETPEELANRLNDVLSKSTGGDLNRLIASQDTTLALAAAFERVRRTVPGQKSGARIRPDTHAVTRFLGFVEGRIKVVIPELWEEVVKSDSIPEKLLKGSLPEVSKLKLDGDDWIVKTDNGTIKLPAENGSARADAAAVQSDGEIAYVAVYGPFPVPYRLLAVNRRTGKVIWSTKVWGVGGLRDYQGPAIYFANIRLTDDLVAVFGFYNSAGYIEVFDKKTGENRGRFCNAYFDKIQPQK
jgi:hypothetical protein